MLYIIFLGVLCKYRRHNGPFENQPAGTEDDPQKCDCHRPFKARNDCVCLLMLTNFSRVGEVANMTVTEVKEGKEVAPGYFSVEVIQKLLHFSPSLCLSLLNNILSFVSFCVLLGNVLHSV